MQSGGQSLWMTSFYAQGVEGGNAALSRATLAGIDQSPMFNPLSDSARIATMPSTGIVPTGAYLANMPADRVPEKMSTPKLRKELNCKGHTCRNQKGGFLSRSELVDKLRSLKKRSIYDEQSALHMF